MLIRDRAVNRGVEAGTYPLEALAKDDSLIELESSKDPISLATANAPRCETQTPLTAAALDYLEHFKPFLHGQAAAEKAPVPDDLVARTKEIKGAAYYLCLLYTSPSPRDATLSRMPSSA